jgi:hypothetical protein
MAVVDVVVLIALVGMSCTTHLAEVDLLFGFLAQQLI